MGDTSIEWTDKTWNPVTGCSHVSEGCRFCYAERITARFDKNFKPWTAPNAANNVRLHPDRLDQPMHWRKPCRVFVNSMSDLFHEQVPFEFIEEVFKVTRECDYRHDFQILTKRPQRALEYWKWRQEVWFGGTHRNSVWPEHVWLGVSVEDQVTADERIPILLQTPASVRFVSYEPALGPVSFEELPSVNGIGRYLNSLSNAGVDSGEGITTKLDWVIAGGESGPKARPAHPDWFRSARDQCQAAGVPFFFKQWGEYGPAPLWEALDPRCQMEWKGKKAAGRELDGRTWDEYPNVGTPATPEPTRERSNPAGH